MPEFSNPFQGNKCDRKLDKEELLRAVRFSLASELEAIQLYEQLKDSIDNEKCKILLDEIADDEKEHVGNFLYLIEYLSKKECTLYNEGKQEAKEIIEEDKKPKD